MKAEGLKIQEAVKMLRVGRCDGIRPRNNGSYMVLCKDLSNISDVLVWANVDFEHPHAMILPLAYVLEPCWSLVNPRPLTEQVEEKRWMWPNGEIAKSSDYKPCKGDLGKWVTVSYEQEVPEPEPVSIELGGVIKTREESTTFRTIPCVQFTKTEQARKYIGKRVLCRILDEP